jgi:hypothetical protein
MKVAYGSKIEKIETRSDRTAKITLGTARELSAAEYAALFSLSQMEGYTLHSSDNDLTEADIPDEKPDRMTGQKTKAQRLRAVIWRIWEQAGSKGSSEDYYHSVMDSLINQMKEKLE